MAANAFISFDHDDQRQVGGFRLLKSNPKHPLDFHDHSLKEPVLARSGKPLKYPPSNPRSKPVRDDIIRRFNRASKLVVLIGDATCSSEWVTWEINTFYDLKAFGREYLATYSRYDVEGLRSGHDPDRPDEWSIYAVARMGYRGAGQVVRSELVAMIDIRDPLHSSSPIWISLNFDFRITAP